MERALVTGADGFIGRHLIGYLVEKGVEIYALVYPGKELIVEKSERVHIISADLCALEIEELVGVIPYGIDIMYHLAWIGVRPEYRDDYNVQIQNIAIANKCMILSVKLGISKVVFPGSTNEYLYGNDIIGERAIPNPSNAYGATKIAIRYLSSNFFKTNNIDFIYSIITGIYAADRVDNNVIYYTIKSLLNGEKPSLTPLEQKWDYVYIDDVVRALYLLGEKGRGGRIYTVGHGDNWPLKDYIKIIKDCINPDASLGIGDIPYSSTDLPNSCVDLTALVEDTGYEAQIDFVTGINRVINELKNKKE